jgi:hypothetical protein
MTRIITPEINKKVKKEYSIRFFSIFFFMLSSVLCIFIIFTLSSYVLLTNYEQIYQTKLENTNGEIVVQNKNFIDRVSKLFTLTHKVPQINSISYFSIFEEIEGYTNNQVVISAFEIYSEEQEKKITIRGVAESREALLVFDSNIKSSKKFKDFEIPLDVLAKQRDISFNITFTYYEN